VSDPSVVAAAIDVWIVRGRGVATRRRRLSAVAADVLIVRGWQSLTFI